MGVSLQNFNYKRDMLDKCRASRFAIAFFLIFFLFPSLYCTQERKVGKNYEFSADWLNGFNIFVYGKPPLDFLNSIHGSAIAWSVYHGGFNPEELRYVRELHRNGVRVASNFPTMQGSTSVINDPEFLLRTSCKSISGKPAKALWIQPDPPYLPCNNNPEWQAFLKSRILEHIDGEADAIHFDEIEGIAGHLYIAGFCDFCMAGFMEYLRVNYSSEQLASLFGITDINNFNYRDYLLSNGAGKIAEDPNPLLRREFVRFQLSSRQKQIKELIQFAKDYARRNIQFTGNTFFLTANKQFYLQDIDFAVFENFMDFPPKGKYIGTYLLGRAIAKNTSKRMVMFPNIMDLYTLTITNSDWSLIPQRLLEATASGETFLIPHNAYIFGGGLATVTGSATVPVETLKPCTDFLWQQKEYLTDAELVADTGILYHYGSALFDYTDYEYETPWYPASRTHLNFLGTALMLQEGHVPFRVIYAGDGKFIKDTLKPEDLNGIKILLLPDASSPRFSRAEIEILNNFKNSGGKIIETGDIPSEYFSNREVGLRELILEKVRNAGENFITTGASENIGITVWKKNNTIILHLINYNYDREKHEFIPEEVSFSINTNYIPEIKGAIFLSPDKPRHNENSTIENGRINTEVNLYKMVILQ